MIDEKEQAWLRLKAYELVEGWWPKGREPEDRTMADRLDLAAGLYQWAITGNMTDA